MAVNVKLKDFIDRITFTRLFLIMFGLWTIDFTTTVIGLEFLGCYEVNEIARVVYNLGFSGYSFFFLSSASILFSASYILVKLKEKYNKSILIKLPLVIYFIAEGTIVICNIILIISKLL